MKRHLGLVALLLLCSGLMVGTLKAQSELAATLEVLASGVEVLRVNTSNWIAVNVEAIVGVGDTIRTDATGRARITFFADGTDTELLPDTEYRIDAFSGDEQQFQISAAVVVGQTIQRLSRLLDASSSYELITPGMSLGARGTQFTVRVEEGGRSAMLVSDGTVAAGQTTDEAAVSPGYGIRAEVGGELSDVVLASTFDQLDAALDGCTSVLTTSDDVSLNVRQGAATDYPRVGTAAASDVTNLIGVTESGGWYRIVYRDGFGWILSTTAVIDDTCAGLRVFPDHYGPEDATLYTSLGDTVQLEDLQTPVPTPAS
ncbi:MAG: SH3 domain-containing protein [Anaerolineae bacterium]